MYGHGALKAPETMLVNVVIYENTTKIRSIFPPYIDWRPQLLPVRHQMDSPICVCFAIACMKEWQEQINCKKKCYFSPQFIYSKKHYEPIGMYTYDALSVVKEYGCALEESYSFKSEDVYTLDIMTQAAKFKITSFMMVTTVNGLKQALIDNGICILALPVYNYSKKFWINEIDGKLIGGHTVAVVGYDDKRNSFIIRNSWGKEWAHHGYAHFPYSDWDVQWECYTAINDPDLISNGSIKKKKKKLSNCIIS